MWASIIKQNRVRGRHYTISQHVAFSDSLPKTYKGKYTLLVLPNKAMIMAPIVLQARPHVSFALPWECHLWGFSRLVTSQVIVKLPKLASLLWPWFLIPRLLQAGF